MSDPIVVVGQDPGSKAEKARKLKKTVLEEEAFLALKGHEHLSIFVALGTVITIFVISASYKQIIELFPTGGGGYLVGLVFLLATQMIPG